MVSVVVTGADGLIGRATCARLLRSGWAVTAFSRSFGPDFADHIGSDVVRIEGDACDPDAVATAIDGADAVVHLAAIPHESLGEVYEVFAVNTGATFCVLSRAGIAGIKRVVIASSINATGIPQSPLPVLPAYFPMDEELPCDIADSYSLSKRVDEESARMAARRWGMTVVALRFPFTADPERLEHGLIAAAQNPARFVREGFSYLMLADAARAVELALTAELDPGAHIVGLAAADTLRPERSAELLARYAPGVPVRRALRGRESLIDTSRARNLIGFTP